MKHFLLLFIFLSSAVFAGGYQAGKESEHYPAEFWQKSDGKYCIKILQFDEKEGQLRNHIFVFDDLIHSHECPCNL